MPTDAPQGQLPWTLLGPVWFFAATAEAALLLLTRSSAIRESGWPLGARLWLLAFDLVALTLAMAVAAAVVRLARLASASAAWAVVGVMVFLSGASWVGFVTTGMFLDHRGLLFGLDGPRQAVSWVGPTWLVILFGSSILVSAALVVITRWSMRRPQLARAATAAATLGVLGLMIIEVVAAPTHDAAFASYEVSDYNTTSSRLAMLREARRARAGPFAHELLTVAESFGAQNQPHADSAIPVARRSIVEAPLPAEERQRLVPLNVVIVEVESMRADVVRPVGDPEEVMPNLDALAGQGLLFSRAYTTATQTNYAANAPLGSQYPLRSPLLYVYPPSLGYPRVLIYEVLKDLGYATGLFSSQDESWGGMINYLRSPKLDRLYHAGSAEAAGDLEASQAHYPRAALSARNGGALDDRYTVSAAVSWMEAQRGPFFAYVNLQSAHFPYGIPDDFPTKFGPRSVPESISFGFYPRSRLHDIHGMYLDSLRYADSQLGRLVAELRARNLWDRTVLVVTADHGELFGEHDLACHANGLYEPEVRIPLVIDAPGLAPRRIDTPAQLLDVPPTIHHLLYLPPHPGYQGVDLLGDAPPQHRSTYLLVDTPLAREVAIVRDGYKLCENLDDGTRELFDLKSDPQEEHDLAERDSRPATALSDRLDTWRAVQLEYYENRAQQALTYPPVVLEQ